MGIDMPKIVDSPKTTPLAIDLRPITLNDIVGQDHILGENCVLRRMVLKNKFQSTIFWGPPGIGKTSIVQALATETNSIFIQLNATNASVKDIRAAIKSAQEALSKDNVQRTFVFIDEIHRFNKSQQDVLLPVVEDGTIILFGATTENPKFAVNSTILSRCLIFEVKPLDQKSMVQMIKRIRRHYKNQNRDITFDKNAIKILINRCSGDARKLITALETIIEILSDDDYVSESLVDQAIPDKHIVFDAHGNDHYDLAHCFQEAVQNSDADGAIYWLAKWISSGEDPAYISRRMLITAFEDCAGNPFAVITAMAAAFATERTGLPECMIPMALATCEMAMSERNKSAYNAIKEAMFDVQNNHIIHVPPGLRAGSTGYIKAVNKVYLKGWSRDHSSVDRNTTQNTNLTMYGIGIEETPMQFGMIDGPTPNLRELIEKDGDNNYCIIQFSGDTSTILYRWNSERSEWIVDWEEQE